MNFLEDLDLKLKASSQESAKKKIYSTLYETKFRLQLEEGTYYDSEIQRLFDALSVSQKKCRYHEGLWWITISFDEKSVSIEHITARLHKISEWKWIQFMAYNIEQRSEDPENFYGIHSHILLQTKTPRQKRDIRSDFLKALITPKVKFIGNGSPKFLDIKPIGHKWYDDKMAYIQGDKWDYDKKGKVHNDTNFRLAHNLENFYLIGEYKKCQDNENVPRIEDADPTSPAQSQASGEK